MSKLPLITVHLEPFPQLLGYRYIYIYIYIGELSGEEQSLWWGAWGAFWTTHLILNKIILLFSKITPRASQLNAHLLLDLVSCADLHFRLFRALCWFDLGVISLILAFLLINLGGFGPFFLQIWCFCVFPSSSVRVRFFALFDLGDLECAVDAFRRRSGAAIGRVLPFRSNRGDKRSGHGVSELHRVRRRFDYGGGVIRVLVCNFY